MLSKKILTGLLSLLLSAGAHAQVINSTTLPVAQLAADASGNLYFCDATTIKKKTTGGVITTIAGTGTGGYSGDGGPATAAQIYSRGPITLDGAGNIYLLDSTARLRKVSTSGIISTIAGTGWPVLPVMVARQQRRRYRQCRVLLPQQPAMFISAMDRK